MSIAGTDFLSQVAAVAVGAVPIVAPRLASRFEHGADVPGAFDGREEAIETAVDVDSGWSAASTRRVLSLLALRDQATEPALVEPVEPAAAIPLRRSRANPTPRTGPAPQIAAPEPLTASPARQSHHKSIVEPAASAKFDRADALSRPLIVEPEPQPRPRVNPAPPAAIDAPPAEVRSSRHEAPPNAKPARRAVQPTVFSQPEEAIFVTPPPWSEVAPPALTDRREIAAAGSAIDPLGTSPAMPVLPPQPIVRPVAVQVPAFAPQVVRRVRRQDETIPPPVPVINITIGRVDVRAYVAPSAAPKPARPARPEPQSLADYFVRRETGR